MDWLVSWSVMRSEFSTSLPRHRKYPIFPKSILFLRRVLADPPTQFLPVPDPTMVPKHCACWRPCWKAIDLTSRILLQNFWHGSIGMRTRRTTRFLIVESKPGRRSALWPTALPRTRLAAPPKIRMATVLSCASCRSLFGIRGKTRNSMLMRVANPLSRMGTLDRNCVAQCIVSGLANFCAAPKTAGNLSLRNLYTSVNLTLTPPGKRHSFLILRTSAPRLVLATSLTRSGVHALLFRKIPTKTLSVRPSPLEMIPTQPPAFAGGLAGIRYGISAIPVRWQKALRGRNVYQPLLGKLLTAAEPLEQS